MTLTKISITKFLWRTGALIAFIGLFITSVTVVTVVNVANAAPVQATIDNPTGSNEHTAPPLSTSFGDSGESGPYARLEFGLAMNGSKANSGIGLNLGGEDGYGLAGAIGYQFNDALSAEILAEWRPKFYSSYNYSSLALIPSIAYAYPFGNARPYVTGGLGMSINQSDTPNKFTMAETDLGIKEGSWDTSQNFALALTFGFGVDFAVNHQIAIRLGYRYLNLGSFESGSTLTLTRNNGTKYKVPNGLGLDDATAHELIFGAGFLF